HESPDRRFQHVLPGEERARRAQRQDAEGRGVGRNARRPAVVERVPGLVGNVGEAARLIGALLVLTAAAPAAAADLTFEVQHGGFARPALLHTPPGARAAWAGGGDFPRGGPAPRPPPSARPARA